HAAETKLRDTVLHRRRRYQTFQDRMHVSSRVAVLCRVAAVRGATCRRPASMATGACPAPAPAPPRAGAWAAPMAVAPRLTAVRSALFIERGGRDHRPVSLLTSGRTMLVYPPSFARRWRGRRVGSSRPGDDLEQRRLADVR